jgi:pimeloyl-ACP methyl ester carboxylesterase
MTVRDRWTDLRGLRFHYRDWGGKGSKIVLLHGLSSQSHIFDLVAPRLAENCRIVAFDQRGHGESDKPSGGYDFSSVTADLYAFLDSMHWRRVIVLGHSWGGNVALEFGARFPDRVAALVFVDGGFLDIQARPEMTWKRTEKELAPPNLIGTNVDQFKEMIKEYVGKLWSLDVESIVLSNFEIQPDQTIRPRLSFENHMKILHAMWEERPRELYPRIKCPVLIIPALSPRADDESFNNIKRPAVEAARKGIGDCEVVWFKDTVHDIPFHRPRRMAGAITRFVKKHNL